jgi:hypothetical protein
MVLQVGSGREIDIHRFDSLDADINDIANALSKIPRFGGHTELPYSVAEHCILASQYGNTPKAKLALLLHDAGEAYIGDITTPLKVMLKEIKEIEANILERIFKKYNLNYQEWHHLVKDVDYDLYTLESNTFFKKGKSYFVPKVAVEINCYPHDVVRDMYLERFQNLCQQATTLV